MRSSQYGLRALTAFVALSAAALCVTSFGVAADAARPQPGGVAHPQLWPATHSRGLVDAATEERITRMLARMSVEEKVGQVIQTDIGSVKPEDLRRYPLGSILAGGGSGPNGDDRSPTAAWLQLARDFRAVALEARPGHEPIPPLFGIDAVHGHNNIVGTVVYPHNIGLGAAHDAELVRRIGAATAEEIAATGWDWAFAPTLAVPQDVRWGRSYEGFAQDPALVRAYASAVVEGLQGSPAAAATLQNGKVAATAKHFIGDGGTAGGIDQGDTRVSEPELIRVHAQGYVGAIEAGVYTVMASYSSWQGQKMHGNHSLLTDVLKGRMGFEGLVVGDWNAQAQVPGCKADHCTAAFNAGVDIFMAPYEWQGLYTNTLTDVRTGAISAARLDDAVRRILRVKFRLGLFDAARPYEGRMALLGSAAHRDLAREAVRKSLVLLKNSGALPIPAGARVMVTGPGSESLPMQCGGWSLTWQGSDTSNADYPGATTIKDAIKTAVEAGGGRLVDGSDLSGKDRPDVAVIVYGETPYAEMFGDVQLPLYNVGQPLEQLRQLHQAGIRTVSVLLSGRPLWTRPEIELSDAFVAAWLPGTEGGGIADLLIGDQAGKPRFDFSGRLSFAWPNGAAPVAGRTGTGGGTGKNPASTWPMGYGLSYAPAAH